VIPRDAEHRALLHNNRLQLAEPLKAGGDHLDVANPRVPGVELDRVDGQGEWLEGGRNAGSNAPAERRVGRGVGRASYFPEGVAGTAGRVDR
jgi:hypothetical protein